MIANAVGHVAGSVVLGRPVPGVWSSPVLLAAALWVTLTSRRAGG